MRRKKNIEEEIFKYDGVEGTLKDICKNFNKNYTEVKIKVMHGYSIGWSILSTKQEYIEKL